MKVFLDILFQQRRMQLFFLLYLLSVAGLSLGQVQNSPYYFYLKGQKISFSPAGEELFVTFQPATSSQEIMKCLQKCTPGTPGIPLPLLQKPDIGTDTKKPTQFSIKLSSQTTQTERTAMLHELQADPHILAVYPVLSLNGKKIYVHNQLLYTLKPGITSSQVEEFLKPFEVTTQETISLKDKQLVVLKTGKNENVFTVSNLLYEKGLVEYAEPDFIMECTGDFYDKEKIVSGNFTSAQLPNDPFFSNQWFLQQANDADIDAPEAWAITEGSQEIVVAVIDGHGYDLTHADLKNAIVAPYDAVNNTTTPTPQNQYAKHGTPCAGLIGATTNNATGIASIGHSIKIMPVSIGYNVQSNGTFSTSNAAISRAASHIINTPGVVAVSNSFALGSMTNSMIDSYNAMKSRSRDGLGAVILASSGNWNRENQVIYPYVLPGVIGVGATDAQDRRAGFSNYGKHLDLVAPGSSLYTSFGTGYGYFVGTSASCPLAAGVVGLMASLKPDIEADVLSKVLLETCDKPGGYSYTEETGYARGTRNKEMGYGRVNAYHALQGVLQLTPPPAPDNLQATAISGSEGILAWTDNSDNEANFKIYVSVGTMENFALLATVSANATQYTPAGLQEGYTYFYKIAACNEDGKSPYSNEVRMVTLGKPLGPDNLIAGEASPSSIELTWEDRAGNEDEFVLQRFLYNGLKTSLDQEYTLPANTLSYTDVSITRGQIYRYRILAKNSYGESEASNWEDIVVGALRMQETRVSDACGKVFLDEGAEGNYANDQAMTMHFLPDNPAHKVRIDFSSFYLETDKDYLYIYEGSTTDTDALIGIYTGYQASFSVMSAHTSGELTLHFASDAQITQAGWQATVGCVLPAPVPPSALTVHAATSHQVDLAWEDNSNLESGFEIWRSVTGVGFTKLQTTEADQVTYEDTTVLPDTEYYYKIRAINQDASSEFSEEISVITPLQEPATVDVWKEKQAIPVGKYAANAFQIDGKAYLGMGAIGTRTQTDIWEYDSETDTWTQKADFPGGKRAYPCSFTINGTGYMGMGSQDDLWEYDSETDTWTQKADFPDGKKYELVSFSIGNKGYAGIGSLYTKLWEYDSETDTWTQKADFPGNPRYFATGFSIGNKGYVGLGFRSQTMSDFWEYDPATDTWTQKADFPGVTRYAAKGFSIGNKGYVGTGKTNTSGRRDFWEYDPATDTWTQRANFGGSARYDATGFSIRDKGYLTTGYSTLRDTWEYTPPAPPPPPAAPSVLTASTHSASSIALAWQDNAIDAGGFELWRSTSGDEFVKIATTKVQVLSFLDQGLTTGQSYRYKVLAVNEFGNSDFSNEARAVPLPGLPAAPVLSEARGISTQAITLSWQDNADNEDYFIVYRRDETQTGWNKLAETEANTNSFTDTGLEENTSYTYRVTAYNLQGESVPGNSLTGTTWGTIPAIPALQAEAVSIEAIQLQWTVAASVPGKFQIARLNTATNTFEQIAEVNAGTNSYQDASLDASTTYFYQIRAVNRFGNSDWSAEVAATTFSDTPTPPSQLEATSLSTTEIILSWQDESGNESYFILEAVTGNGEFKQIARIPANQTMFIHQNLTPNTTYYYQIKAVNEAQAQTDYTSDYSGQAHATTLPVLPEAPFHLQATALSEQAVQLSWESTQEATDGFVLYRFDTETGIFTKVAQVSPSLRFWTDTEVFPATQYTYFVQAYNVHGNSEKSNSASTTTHTAVPEQLQAAATSSTEILITWKIPNTYAETLTLEVAGLQESFTEIARFSTSTTEYRHQNLLPAQTYSYRIKASNDSWQAYSDVATTVTLPLAATGLHASTLSSGSILLEWEPPAMAEKFEIYRLQASHQEFAKVGEVHAPQHTWLDQNLAPSTEYTYQTKTIYQTLSSASSESARATTWRTLRETLISPNPGTGIFTIELGHLHQETATLKVFDLQGKVIQQASLTQIHANESYILDLTSQESGEYLLQIQAGDQQWIERLVVY